MDIPKTVRPVLLVTVNSCIMHNNRICIVRAIDHNMDGRSSRQWRTTLALTDVTSLRRREVVVPTRDTLEFVDDIRQETYTVFHVYDVRDGSKVQLYEGEHFIEVLIGQSDLYKHQQWLDAYRQGNEVQLALVSWDSEADCGPGYIVPNAHD